MIPTSLPLDATPFIGRRDELGVISRRLADPACRLLTLVGPGGIGKTRLALAIARDQLEHARDGVTFIPLQSVVNPAQVPAAIAGALGLRLNASDDIVAELHHMVAGMNALLVLDNFEQLLDGADMLSRLLAEAPGVQLLVTSRERLRLIEEWVFDVGGLDVPPDDLCDAPVEFSAVRLFLSVAQRAAPGFSLEAQCGPVVRVCQLLDGMPLAIELAAAWARLLSVTEIEAELRRGLDILETPARNMPPQHRTMRAVFDQSWQWLTPHEQLVFARLSVFSGGFSAAAAEQVTGATRLDLAQLLDKSWLRRDSATGRYAIHELARQYGAEHLSDAECHDAHEHHSRFFCQFLQQRWPEQQGSAYKEAYLAIGAELDNVRTAWNWAVDTLNAGNLNAAICPLWFFFDSGSRFREGAMLFAAAVEHARAAGPAFEPLLGRLLARKGALKYSLDHFRIAEENLIESLTLLEKHGLYEDIAFAELELGMTLLFNRESPERGRHLVQSALARYEALGDRWGTAYAHYWLGLSQSFGIAEPLQADALRESEALVRQAEREFHALGNQWGVASVHTMLSNIAFDRGDIQTAWNLAVECKNLFSDIEVVWGVSIALQTMVQCAWVLGWADELRQSMLEALRLELKYQLFNHAFQPASVAARLRLEAGDTLGAYEVFGAIDAQRERLGRARDPYVHSLLEPMDQATTPGQLAAIARGRARSFEEVLRELIAELEQALAETVPLATAASPNDALDEPLTARELEILRLVADGRSNREIAAALYLSVGTVKTHIHNLSSKLGAANRTEAAAMARRLGLVSEAAE